VEAVARLAFCSPMTAPFPEIGYERICDAESSTNDALGPSIK
jgi:hypothetical protein